MKQVPVQSHYSSKFIADLLDYSEQTIRNDCKKLDITPEKIRGNYQYTFEQLKQIANYHGEEIEINENIENENIDNNNEINNRTLSMLEKVIDTLNEQLKEKDEQIKNKDNQIEQLIETNKALSASNAIKEVNEHKEMLLVDKNKDVKKKGFWQRLFN